MAEPSLRCTRQRLAVGGSSGGRIGSCMARARGLRCNENDIWKRERCFLGSSHRHEHPGRMTHPAGRHKLKSFILAAGDGVLWLVLTTYATVSAPLQLAPQRAAQCDRNSKSGRATKVPGAELASPHVEASSCCFILPAWPFSLATTPSACFPDNLHGGLFVSIDTCLYVLIDIGHCVFIYPGSITPAQLIFFPQKHPPLKLNITTYPCINSPSSQPSRLRLCRSPQSRLESTPSPRLSSRPMQRISTALSPSRTTPL